MSTQTVIESDDQRPTLAEVIFHTCPVCGQQMDWEGMSRVKLSAAQCATATAAGGCVQRVRQAHRKWQVSIRKSRRPKNATGE